MAREAAATSLGKLSDHRAVEALMLAKHDTMAEASEEAIKSLGLRGDARALRVLQPIVRNPQGLFLVNVRRTAEKAIRRIGDK